MKNINLYVDGADLTQMTRLAQDPRAKGFTTNPSLMHKAGITDYEYFAHKVLPIVAGRPVSFEVFADDFTSMERQAHVISAWGKNVFVKIPIMNTRAESSLPLIAALSRAGVSLNVTAIMTLDQVFGVLDAVDSSAKTIVSVFAGRIADTGRDPIPMMTQAAKAISRLANVELLWASVRELLNVFHAEQSGCDVVTVPPTLWNQFYLWGKNLENYSLETVQMFYDDARRSGYTLDTSSEKYTVK